jgi:hypothetical protein
MPALLVLMPEKNQVIVIEEDTQVAVYDYDLDDASRVRTLLNIKEMGEGLSFGDVERFFAVIGYQPKFLSDLETIEVLIKALFKLAEEI